MSSKNKYAVVGQDWGVCPQSHGSYEIHRFSSLPQARKLRDDRRRRAEESREYVKDTIWIAPVNYNDDCEWCEKGCFGHVDWRAKEIV